MTQPLPTGRACNLRREYGPAFQAMYQALYRAMERSVRDGEEADRIRRQVHEAGAVALASQAWPFGALLALFMEGLHDQWDSLSENNRLLRLGEFGRQVNELCQTFRAASDLADERYRHGYLVAVAAPRQVPTWEQWLALSESERQQWLPIEAEPLASIQARVIERQERLERARRVLAQVDGWLVTTAGRIVPGPFVQF